MKRVKVTFPLTQDEDGYPPANTEQLWAECTEHLAEYVIDNIPFFARQATLGDVVRTVKRDDLLHFDQTVKRSSNSLIRVVVSDVGKTVVIRQQLAEFGCSTESFVGNRLVAVNIPETTSLKRVQEYLAELEASSVLTYEEPILRHPEVS